MMQQTVEKTEKEERAIILDFLPNGYALEQGTMKTPIAQALGINFLSILELIPKREVFLS